MGRGEPPTARLRALPVSCAPYQAYKPARKPYLAMLRETRAVSDRGFVDVALLAMEESEARNGRFNVGDVGQQRRARESSAEHYTEAAFTPFISPLLPRLLHSYLLANAFHALNHLSDVEQNNQGQYRLFSSPAPPFSRTPAQCEHEWTKESKLVWRATKNIFALWEASKSTNQPNKDERRP